MKVDPKEAKKEAEAGKPPACPDLLRLPGMCPIGDYVDHDNNFIVQVNGTVGRPVNCSLFCKWGTNGWAPNASRYRDFPVQDQPTYVELLRRRYTCNFEHCRAEIKTPYEALPDIDENRDMTIRFREHLERHATNMIFATAADINGVPEVTVQRVFHDYAKVMLDGYVPRMPRVLCIDEKAIGASTCLTIGDPENSTLLDIRPSRRKADITPYFMAMTDRKNVEVVCQDMWKTYQDLTKKVFPNALTVIDVFHVVRMGDFAVEAARIDTYDELSSDDRKKLKRRNKLLKMHWDDLKKDAEAFEMVNGIFSRHPKLKAAYFIKEELYDMYKCQTRLEAEKALSAFIERASEPGMKQFFGEYVISCQNHRPYILNHIDNRYTNAFIERMNGLIDTINRESVGLTYEVLRAKALLRHAKLVEERINKRRRKTPKPDDDIPPGVLTSRFLTAFDDEEDEFETFVEVRRTHAGVPLSLLEADWNAGIIWPCSLSNAG